MQKSNFMSEMELLKQTYGDRAYPDPRIESIWQWAKSLDDGLFKRIVGNLVAECDRPPLIVKFKEEWIRIRGQFATQKPSWYSCFFCADSGFYIDPNSPPPFVAYACCCALGERASRATPKWMGQFIRNVPYEHELFKNKKTIKPEMKSIPKVEVVE